ncbi:MAG: DUF2892 domain-containing protein [Vicinamibacterales bacterium]
MTVNRVVRIVAGSFILFSLAMAHAMGQVDLTTMSWLWFTLFVGANLFQSGFTTFCPLDIVLRRLGVPDPHPLRCKVDSRV